MPAVARPVPTPGHPIPREGLPSLWITWGAKILGGAQCTFQPWFRSHFWFAKLPERNPEQLQRWNLEHNEMMRRRRVDLEEQGWTCQSERPVHLRGKTAELAGKEDLVATMPGHILVIDGKTGRRRDSDFFQVVLYLYARLVGPRPAGPGIKLAGEVFYKDRQIINVRVVDVQQHNDAIVSMVQSIASPTRPTPNPSRFECASCPISREDCPERYQDGDELALTEEF